MRNSLLFIAIFTAAFVVHELGSRGKLSNRFLVGQLLPPLRRINAVLTDAKFKLRGPTKPKQPIVIVEIDTPSIAEIGRWPWRRDYVAELIDKTFALGAKEVGLDIVFSEKEKLVPDELVEILRKNSMGWIADQFETDPELAARIKAHADKLVLSWVSESACQPLYSKAEGCPMLDPEAWSSIPEHFSKFAIRHVESNGPFRVGSTPIASAPTVIPNLELFDQAALHEGFANSFRDPDGLVRRTSLLMMVNGKPHPSLELEMARVALGEEVAVSFDGRERVAGLEFLPSGRKIPVSPSGVMEINYRGPERTYPYVSALDVLEAGKLKGSRDLAAVKRASSLKGAIALIGVSALALADIGATPFDNTIPGVEFHATALDNLLSGDMLVTGAAESSWMLVIVFMVCLMTIGAFFFTRAARKLDAMPGMGLFLGAFAVLFAIDTRLLFPADHNWNTSFLYLEILVLALVTIGEKYINEEHHRKFLRAAFSKYVSPQVVETIIRDPSQLHVGGQKKNLTVLFADIRGFTTFSETMDAKLLSEFLNEYFGLMTEIVFQCNGTLDKYIGDAVMAFFGAPLDDPSHARQACDASRLMVRKAAEHRDLFKAKYGVDIQIGVGLNSGLVSVGNMGSDRSFGYTVLGDNVNLASRLEGVTKQYGVSVLTTHLTLAEIQQTGEVPFPYRVIDIVKVKGKSDAVQLIQILEEEPNSRGLALFDEAREHYRSRQWDLAIGKFLEASRLISPGQDDGPCRVFIERCKEWKKSPPPEEWDGTWALDVK